MSHDEGLICACVSEHRPAALELQLHHVFPIYLGGAKDGLTVPVCPTTHTNIHELLRAMLRAGTVLTFSQCTQAQDRPVSRYAHHLAVEGYRAWAATQPEG